MFTLMTIQIETSDSQITLPERPVLPAVRRGWSQRCPSCGAGQLFRAYLKVNDNCPSCSEELHHHRADDAPPYFTMLITGHVVIGGLLVVERLYAPEFWVHMVIWGPMLLALSLWLLPRVKGSLVALQWALRMHGFGGPVHDADGEPEPSAPPARPSQSWQR